jgi:hypothetical protein
MRMKHEPGGHAFVAKELDVLIDLQKALQLSNWSQVRRPGRNELPRPTTGGTQQALRTNHLFFRRSAILRMVLKAYFNSLVGHVREGQNPRFIHDFHVRGGLGIECTKLLLRLLLLDHPKVN